MAYSMITRHDRAVFRSLAADLRSEIGITSLTVDPADVAAVIELSFEDVPGVRLILSGSALVAGMMDRAENHVIVAGDIRADWKRLTALHLIGMTLLSDAQRHADRAITGGERVTAGRHDTELAADLLAIEIAAPADLVEAEFLRRFGAAVRDSADVNEMASNLRTKVPDTITAEELHTCGWMRRAMLISSATGYGVRSFAPLHAAFGISATAMAVRLQELALVR
ncbi:MAG TPA: hypothetical protein VF701_04080 [Thermoanaerobaculia bacterium]